MPPRNADKAYPFAIRGRVEVALFNCPVCNELLKFRGRTKFRYRCPDCGTTIYVGLRVSIARRSGGIVGRPLDTLVEGSKGSKARELVSDPTREELAALSSRGKIEPLEPIELTSWEPGEPLHELESEELIAEEE